MALKKIVKVEPIVEVKQKQKKPNIGYVRERVKYLQSRAFLRPEDKEELESLLPIVERSNRGKRSKSKGGNYERKIASQFQQQYGVELSRTPQSGGFAKKSEKADEFRGDIITTDKDVELLIHIECKDQKTWSLPQWLKQSKEDCPKGKVPVVIFHKYNTSEDFICLPLKDFFALSTPEKILRRK